MVVCPDPPRNSEPGQARESEEATQMSNDSVTGDDRQYLRPRHYQDREELIDDIDDIFAVSSQPLERGIPSKQAQKRPDIPKSTISS
jgi:hypothetical protein